MTEETTRSILRERLQVRQSMRNEYIMKYRYIEKPVRSYLKQEFKHFLFFADSDEEALEYFAKKLTEMMAKPECLIAVPVWVKRMSIGGTKWHNVLTKIEKRKIEKRR
tara:strand:- start:722 stop:1045 length:324 start_codon:yes stop_codon:yes gene_type:complete